MRPPIVTAQVPVHCISFMSDQNALVKLTRDGPVFEICISGIPEQIGEYLYVQCAASENRLLWTHLKLHQHQLVTVHGFNEVRVLLDR